MGDCSSSGDKPDFESCLDIINEELSKRRGKWRLNALAWMDFDDVCQKIRIHIFNKWSQWDNSRPLKPWLNTIITNQMTNLVRNNYSSFSKPCSQCIYNLGAGSCELYGSQSDACPDYSKWQISKKNAYDIRLPVSIYEKNNPNETGSSQAAMDIPCRDVYVDYDVKIGMFHDKMKEKLTLIEWKVYNFLYIENKSEIETAQSMGYKTTEKNRSPGYKQIKKIKNKIFKAAKLLVHEL
jgi:hypothetical protein